VTPDSFGSTIPSDIYTEPSSIGILRRPDTMQSETSRQSFPSKLRNTLAFKSAAPSFIFASPVFPVPTPFWAFLWPHLRGHQFCPPNDRTFTLSSPGFDFGSFRIWCGCGCITSEPPPSPISLANWAEIACRLFGLMQYHAMPSGGSP